MRLDAAVTKNPVINDRVWRELRARIGELGKYSAKIGAVGEEASEAHEGGPTNATLLAIHELGADIDVGERSDVATRETHAAIKVHIPERRPIRRTFAEKRGELISLTARVARDVLAGKLDPIAAMGIIGAWGAAAIKRTITAGLTPPNAPSTIAKKGSSKPLVDTGQLVGSISFVVDDSGAGGGVNE